MLGEPTGISLKSWLSKINAWDAGIACVHLISAHFNIVFTGI
jgi:hypothetical protein